MNDARQIDRKVLEDYAAYLRDVVGRVDLAVSTALNRLSGVNRTMAALRGDQYVKLPSPSKPLGMRRTGVRYSVPQGQDRWRADWIARNTSTSFASDEDDPSRNPRALPASDALDLAEKACGLVSRTSSKSV